jgi:hypothetical protein
MFCSYSPYPLIMAATLSSRPCGIFVRQKSFGAGFCSSTWIASCQYKFLLSVKFPPVSTISSCQYNSFGVSYSYFINLSPTVLIVENDSLVKQNASLLPPPPLPSCSPQFSQAKTGLSLKIHQVGVIAHLSYAEFTTYLSSRSGLYRVYLNTWTKFRSEFATRKQCVRVYEHRPANTFFFKVQPNSVLIQSFRPILMGHLKP